MKAEVDRLAADLADKYVHYLETLLVDLWSEDGLIEFRIGFSLRSDHVLRQLTVKVPADVAANDGERAVIIAAVFEEIEDQVDAALTAERHTSN